MGRSNKRLRPAHDVSQRARRITFVTLNSAEYRVSYRDRGHGDMQRRRRAHVVAMAADLWLGERMRVWNAERQNWAISVASRSLRQQPRAV